MVLLEHQPVYVEHVLFILIASDARLAEPLIMWENPCYSMVLSNFSVEHSIHPPLFIIKSFWSLPRAPCQAVDHFQLSHGGNGADYLICPSHQRRKEPNLY